MSRADEYRQLFGDIGRDRDDYGRLEALLDEQFAAALAHDTAALTRTGDAILALADTLEVRRKQRVTLAAALCGGEAPSMADLLERLPAAARPSCEALWRELVLRVSLCKALNERNGRLLMTQRETMARALFGDSDVYAPA